MVKLLYSVSMSLDGFIAGPHGDVSWLRVADALDEILVLIEPVLLGDGTRLFEHPGGSTVRLERISLTEGPIATSLWMRVLPRPSGVGGE